jgi:hypothetical protein
VLIDPTGAPAVTTKNGVTGLPFSTADATWGTSTTQYTITGIWLKNLALMTATVETTHTVNLAKGPYLAHETHGGTDVLGPPLARKGLKVKPTRSIVYSGTLGTATVDFFAEAGAKSNSIPAGCMGSMAAGARSVVSTNGDATVSGSVALSFCMDMKATLGNPPPDTNVVASGSLSSMTASSKPAPMLTFPGSSGGGSGSGGAGASPTAGAGSSVQLTIKSSTPPNGATGVSLNPTFSVTLSAAPPAGTIIMMVVMPASSPTGMTGMNMVGKGPAQFDPTTLTATGTPSQPLQPNTQYQLQLRNAMTLASGGAPLASITFTTGAS